MDFISVRSNFFDILYQASNRIACVNLISTFLLSTPNNTAIDDAGKTRPIQKQESKSKRDFIFISTLQDSLLLIP